MAGKNPYTTEEKAKLKKRAGNRINFEDGYNKQQQTGGSSSSWSPWQLVGQVFGNRQDKTPNSETPNDYGTTKLERKNEEIKEVEKALEEEKRKIAKNERDKAKLEEHKEKHRIADQRLKDLQLQLQNAKNQNKNNNGGGGSSSSNNFRIIERPVWIGRKN